MHDNELPSRYLVDRAIKGRHKMSGRQFVEVMGDKARPWRVGRNTQSHYESDPVLCLASSRESVSFELAFPAVYQAAKGLSTFCSVIY